MRPDLRPAIIALGRRLRMIFGPPYIDAPDEKDLPMPRAHPSQEKPPAVSVASDLRTSARHLKTVATAVRRDSETPDSFEASMRQLLGRIR